MTRARDKILVLGGSGLLGSTLLSGRYFQSFDYVVQGRHCGAQYKADLLDAEQVRLMIQSVRPNVIINLVGLTSVDTCELFPNEAYKVNVRTVEVLVDAISSLSPRPYLIHVSTDQVYDGAGAALEHEIKLTNYYAFSKYASELIACTTKSIVLRTNFFGKSFSKDRSSITDWLHKEICLNRSISVIEDIFFSPLSIDSLCRIIEKIIISRAEGIFNIGSHDGISKADFAYNFIECLGLPTSAMVRRTRGDIKSLIAYRPSDMRLDVSKFENTFRIGLPTLKDEIRTVAGEYK